MKRTATWYMHTIDGGPAMWNERDQVLYRVAGRQQRATLHRSLAEIQRQQRAHVRTRASWGYVGERTHLSYVLVDVGEVTP